MQKFCCMVIMVMATVVISCHTAKRAQHPSTEAAVTPYQGKGLELIGSSDCVTCHSRTEMFIGPAFGQIAQRYKPTPENIDKLVKKVMAGGSGNWRDVPMTPHRNTPPEDIREMVKYILSLRK